MPGLVSGNSLPQVTRPTGRVSKKSLEQDPNTKANASERLIQKLFVLFNLFMSYYYLNVMFKPIVFTRA